MKFRWPWTRKRIKAEMDSVESMLESIFKPVSARPGFAEDLRQRLVGKPGPLAAAGRSTLSIVLMVGGALIGLVVFIIAGIRSVITLLTGIKQIGGKVRERRALKRDKTPTA